MIKEPRQRSARWVSTSIPQTEWGSPLALYSSADYHVNNLVSPVLFHEGLSLVPENAVVVEIAPHALLQVRHLVKKHFLSLQLRWISSVCSPRSLPSMLFGGCWLMCVYFNAFFTGHPEA